MSSRKANGSKGYRLLIYLKGTRTESKMKLEVLKQEEKNVNSKINN